MALNSTSDGLIVRVGGMGMTGIIWRRGAREPFYAL